MKINNKGKGALIAAITAAATLLSCGLAAASASAAGVDYLPTIGQVPTYTKFQPTADPGKNASDYFQPYWYAKNANDNGGTHIQAHGGQVVKVGDAYYWYGEDRSNGYDNSPGVHAYMSTDLYNWTDLGVALRAVTSKSQLTDKSNADYAYFDKAYNLTKSDGSVDAAKADAIFPYLNTNPDQDGDGAVDSVQGISSVRRSSTTRRTSNTCCGGIPMEAPRRAVPTMHVHLRAWLFPTIRRARSLWWAPIVCLTRTIGKKPQVTPAGVRTVTAAI